jgi:protein phosphatase
MIIGVSTDVGRIRDINQDSFYCSDIEELPLYVVADGMGGHNAGEVASYIAIESVKEVFHKNKELLLAKEIEIPQFINDALNTANERILEKSNKEERYNGMGTTITLVYIQDDEIFIGHIGDSRAYLLSNGELVQLTQDHSLVAELLRKGSISEEEAMNHPQKNIITRALGTDKNVKIDILSRKIKKKDIILLCTDGLTNMVSESKIKEIIIESKDLQTASNILINTANELGGLDNTTVMLIGIE